MMGDTGKISGGEPPITFGGRLRNLWMNFAEETTFHACKNIVNRDRSRLERLLWGCVFFGMIFGLAYILGELLASYKKYPTVTRSSVEYLSSMDFPMLTFCNANGFDKTKVNNKGQFNDFMALKNTIVREMMQMNLSLEHPWFNETHFDLFNRLALRKKDHLVLAMLNYRRLDPEIFDEVTRNTGICFRLNSKEMILRHGAQGTETVGLAGTMEFLLDIHQEKYFAGSNTFAGMQLYINHPSYRQTDVDSVILLSPGTTTFISMTKNKYKFLPHPYKSFGSDSCLDTDSPSFRNPLKYFSTYSWGACLEDCYANLVATLCACKAATDPDELDLPYCKVHQFAECNIREYSKVFVNMTSQREICDCKKPCTFFTYDTKISQGAFPSMAAAEYMVENKLINSTEYARQNLVHIQIYYEQLILNKIEHEPMYDLGSILGTLGGQMGFFLGASAMTVYELFNVCLTTVKLLCKNLVTPKQTRIVVMQKNCLPEN